MFTFYGSHILKHKGKLTLNSLISASAFSFHVHLISFSSCSKEVSESLPLNEVIVTMDVEYQEENRIVCNIVDLDLSNKFSIITDNLQKNCKLTLLHQLDYSVQSRYNVTVSVRPDTSQSRRKRQIYGTYR